MLRFGASSLARRTILRSSSNKGTPACLVPHSSFHLSAHRRSDEVKADESAAVEVPVVPSSKGGLLGTGYSEWFALPIGMVAAVPIVQFDWYVINEETQLAAVFVAFCVTLYTQGGEAISKALSQKSATLLKEHNESEDAVIAAKQCQLDALQNTLMEVEHFEAIHKLRADSFDKINKAGQTKPLYDFKAQLERTLDMIAQEETSVTEKTKAKLMVEATEDVSQQFSTSKALKKAALDAAIATIKGGAANKDDPVKGAFVKFFRDKASALSKTDDGTEAQEQRALLVNKINSIAKNEGFYFSFDEAGKPKMNV